jgi:hypothetical protein
VTSFAAALYLHTAPFIAAATALYEGLGYRRDPATDIDIGAHFGVAPSGSAIIRAYRLGLAPARRMGTAKLRNAKLRNEGDTVDLSS